MVKTDTTKYYSHYIPKLQEMYAHYINSSNNLLNF